MGNSYDLLVSADALVENPDAVAATWVQALGLPTISPRWMEDYADSGYRAIFARVHPSLQLAPTRLEIIGPRPGAPAASRARTVLAAQLNRPLRTHATVITSTDVPGLVDDLKSRGVVHWVNPFKDDVADRVWIGIDPENRAGYTPEFDGGLRVEIISRDVLPFAADAAKGAPKLPPDLSPEAMLRIATREFLVADLDLALSQLERSLDWQPNGAIEEDPEAGIRRAALSLSIPHGADFHVIAPTQADGHAGRHLTRWGPGPFTTQVAVVDLEAKAEELRARGTLSEHLPATGTCPERLRVAESATPGALFEFVQLDG